MVQNWLQRQESLQMEGAGFLQRVSQREALEGVLSGLV